MIDDSLSDISVLLHLLGDPFDTVSIRIGSNRFATQQLALISNVRAPGKSGITYEVSHVIRCATMFFKFEFSSSTTNPFQHLLVVGGQYAEYISEPLEVLVALASH